MSSSEVRKFTIQARNTNVSPITALEVNEGQARHAVSRAIRLERQAALGGYKAIQQPGLLSDNPLCGTHWASFRAAQCDTSVPVSFPW